MKRALPFVFAALLLPLSACEKSETTTPDEATTGQGEGGQHGKGHHDQDFEGREVVDNWQAQPGDVTTCPFSGKKFEVEDDSPRFDYEGQSFVFCCDKCLGKVEAEPDKYLGELASEANAGAAPADDAAADDAAADDAAADDAAPAE